MRPSLSRAAVANRGGAVLLYCAAPGRSHVHTQPFAFRAPQADDESVKMSTTTRTRSSALISVLAAGLFGRVRLPKRQFLFNTNEPFSRSANFATHTKQSTSFFLFSTNERSPIFHHASRITNHLFPIRCEEGTDVICCAIESRTQSRFCHGGGDFTLCGAISRTRGRRTFSRDSRRAGALFHRHRNLFGRGR